MPDDDPTEPDDGDLIYKWVIRSLYVGAVCLNIWFLWSQMPDTDRTAIQNQVKDAWDKVTKPSRDRKHFQKQANAVVFEAMQVVDRGQ